MILTDAVATEAVGRALGERLDVGDVVALSGFVGAGKTSLARGVMAGLGYDRDVISPTFQLVVPYTSPDVRIGVWHVDLYRVRDAREVDELGLDEALADGALVVEWPERLGPALRMEALALHLAVEGSGRRLTWQVPAAWEARWPPPAP